MGKKVSTMKNTVLVLMLLLATASWAGCGTTAKFIYPADSKRLTHFSDRPGYDKVVAVTPFEDMRGDSNEAGTVFLYLIPLMPYGFVEYERPEAARMFNSINEFDFDASEDLAKATAYSIRKSGLFSDAFFTHGGDKDKADFLLEGKMLSTTYQGTVWTYGLSVFGPLLWFIGLPAGTSYNEMILALQLTDRATGRLIWEKNYDKNTKITQGLYYAFGHDVRGYPELMQTILNDAVEEIARELPQKTSS